MTAMELDHFLHSATYDTGSGCNPPLLLQINAQNLQQQRPASMVVPAMTGRRIDKSGLQEFAETDPVTCPRPSVRTRAEATSLRIKLETIPEAVNELEEHNGGMLNEAAGMSRGGRKI